MVVSTYRHMNKQSVRHIFFYRHLRSILQYVYINGFVLQKCIYIMVWVYIHIHACSFFRCVFLFAGIYICIWLSASPIPTTLHIPCLVWPFVFESLENRGLRSWPEHARIGCCLLGGARALGHKQCTNGGNQGTSPAGSVFAHHRL